MLSGCATKEDFSDPGAISKALGGVRAVEPQLSGNFRHAACAPLGPAPPTSNDIVPEPACPGPGANRRDLARVLGAIKRRGSRSLDLAGARAALIAEVILGRSPAHLRSAIERLYREARRAGHTKSESAGTWSDLSAAHLVAAQRHDDPIALFAALDAADRAVAADGRNPEARFNRAVALEYLALEAPAREAWRDYLKIDPSSGWAGEAHQRLDRLVHEAETIAIWTEKAERLAEAALDGDASAAGELARSAPERARQLVQREILPRWGRTALAGDEASATRALSTARVIARALRPIDGDALLDEAITAIDAAESNSERLDALRRGHEAFGEGMAIYEGRKQIERASARFDDALAWFKSGGSPLDGWATVYVAICEYLLSLPGSAAVRLEVLTEDPALDRYPALAGRALWQLGLSELARGERERALERFKRASTAFRRTGDRESLVAIEDLMASAYDFLGDTSRSWRYRYLTLRALQWVTSYRRRWVIIKTTAESLQERGNPHLVLPLLDELVRISSNDPEGLSQALLRRSVALAGLGDQERAAQDAANAEAAVAHIEDPNLRSRIGVDLLVGRVSSILRSNPAAALRLLDEPLRFYRRARNELLLARVLLARARAALATGHEIEAEENLNEALDRAERQWQDIRDEQLKLSFLGELQTAFDDLLLAQYRRDAEAAFNTTERARSRLLLEQAGERPLTAAGARAELSPGTVLVEYALVRNRLLVWTLARERLSLAVVDWTAVSGSELMRRLDEAVRKGDDEALRNQLARLHQFLIRPIADRLPAGTPLIFVPHGAVSDVPFSALLDRSTGRYLIEDHPVVVAPSASLHLVALRRARELGGRGSPNLLAVGDPAFDRRWHPDLGPLPGARREVEVIAGLYRPDALVLVGEQATSDAVANAMRGRSVIHFAAHALISAAEPERSALALAPASTEPSSGDLTAAIIDRLSLSGTNLVVLSSCSGAAGPIVKGEGTMSLARSFLAAGASTVVAGLWPVEDHPIADFFELFHKRLRAGDNPADALQSAQLHFLRSPDPDRRSPRAWGGLQAYGASGEKLSRGRLTKQTARREP